MPIKFKVDVLEMLKDAGYTTYRIKKEKLLAESTVQKLRNDEMVSIDNISRLCQVLQCQPGDIIEFVPEEE
ncbi:MAG: helix-turn-helix transcriptional regulator [Clostridia bacterium]|nr:helix-turn-helix transcriptional regulator [Clostridia bacterium]